MPRTNIFAYTASSEGTCYPEYVSLNREENGEISLTVREPAKPGPYSDKDCGNAVSITLPSVALRDLYDALRETHTPPMMRARGLA